MVTFISRQLKIITLQKTLFVLSILLITLILLIVVGAVAATAQLRRVKHALHVAGFTNNLNASIVPLPGHAVHASRAATGTGTNAGIYSPDTARCAANLIKRLTDNVKHHMARANRTRSTLSATVVDHSNLPEGLMHRKSIYYKKRVIAWVLVDSKTRPTAIWVVFRGTVSKREWLKNCEVRQVSPSFWDIPEIGVHNGFAVLYHHIRQQLLIHAVDNLPVYICGYSMGAALATLFAFELTATPNRPAVRPAVYVYIIAGPRIGNSKFTEALRNAQTNGPLRAFFHIMNLSDVIISIPFTVTPNLKSPQTPWLYEHAGDMLYFTDNWGNWANNHLLPIYIKNLNHLTKLTKIEY